MYHCSKWDFFLSMDCPLLESSIMPNILSYKNVYFFFMCSFTYYEDSFAEFEVHLQMTSKKINLNLF